MTVLSLITLTACCKEADVLYCDDAEMPINMNGKLLNSRSKAIASAEGVALPVISCFEYFGASIVWNSDTEANIIYNNDSYILNTGKMTFSKSDVPYSNYLYGRYGGNYLLYEQNKEIFLDVNTFIDFFERFGICVDVNVDEEKGVVYINYSESTGKIITEDTYHKVYQTD